MKQFLIFVKYFFIIYWHVRAVITLLLIFIFLAALGIAHVEKISLFNSVYFSFITVLTIGYGDISPSTPMGKVLCLILGVIGMIFVGITVAVSNHALKETVKITRPIKSGGISKPAN